MKLIPLYIALIGFMLLPGAGRSQHNLDYTLYFEQLVSSDTASFAWETLRPLFQLIADN